MVAGRMMAGIGLAAALAAGLAVAPATGAPDRIVHAPRRAMMVRGIGAFTPASADPRLAAVFARGGLDAGGFRFTPSESRGGAGHAVTVAVRARSVRGGEDAARIASTATAAPSVSLAPIAYNLGVAVGWRRFAVSGDMAHVDLAGLPGSRETVDVGVSYIGNRFSGGVKASSDRPLAGAPKLVEEAPAMAIDVGGSYALTRNLDVTAGLRYRSERDRLQRVENDRRDSQALYVGTAFRF